MRMGGKVNMVLEVLALELGLTEKLFHLSIPRGYHTRSKIFSRLQRNVVQGPFNMLWLISYHYVSLVTLNLFCFLCAACYLLGSLCTLLQSVYLP